MRHRPLRRCSASWQELADQVGKRKRLIALRGMSGAWHHFDPIASGPPATTRSPGVAASRWQLSAA
jgi:hypothetical protein